MISFETIPDLLRTNWEQLAELTAQYEFMENMSKTILANNSPLEWTEAHKEREARKSEAFRIHIEGLREARKGMLVARTYQDALHARQEWYRTQSANARIERQSY